MTLLILKKIYTFLFAGLMLSSFTGGLSCYGQEHSSIVVSNWINKPEKEDFNKSLLFVDFWATWCGPCIYAMPHVEELKKEFNRDVLFMNLSKETEEKVQAFMDKHNKDFFSAVDHTRISYLNFNVESIPYGVLLNSDGKVVWSGQPVELKSETLKELILKNRSHVGLTNIIHTQNDKVYNENWKVVSFTNTTYRYLKPEHISNSYSKQDEQYYFSGNIKYITSKVFNIPLRNIKSDFDDQFILKVETDNMEDLKKTFVEFLLQECQIDLNWLSQMTEAYVLKDVGNLNLLSSDYTDLEKGENVFLADDMSVIIDNSTIEEMTVILSDLSESRFVYKGADKRKYDWEILYKYNNLTVEQFTSEMNFNLSAGSVEMKFLNLTKKTF